MSGPEEIDLLRENVRIPASCASSDVVRNVEAEVARLRGSRI